MGIFNLELGYDSSGKAVVHKYYDLDKGDIIMLSDDYKRGRRSLLKDTYYIVDKVSNKEIVLFKLDSIDEGNIRRVHINDDYDNMLSLVSKYIPIETSLKIKDKFNIYIYPDSIINSSLTDESLLDSVIASGKIDVSMDEGKEFSISYRGGKYYIQFSLVYLESSDTASILLDGVDNIGIKEVVSKAVPYELSSNDKVILSIE